ncbi:hypothetical protein XENOCAPTIV_009519 [Xenoophorus captivus]|uniref:Uncharacterized protein n=1 Tax=Xenoophorus captivus TaxID=1517983 RepID=A0ABV0SHF0_9TELE
MRVLLQLQLLTLVHILLCCESLPFRKMEFAIQHTWDSDLVDHDPIRISFSDGKSGLKMEVSGPFFNDPAAPPGEPGIAFPGLWNYEGKRKLLSFAVTCNCLCAKSFNGFPATVQ